MNRRKMLAVGLLAGCSLGGIRVMGHSPETGASAPAVDRPGAEFAVDLYSRLRSRPGNLAFSPFSISTALGMTMAGAKGATAREMGEVLRRPADDPASQAAIGEIIAALRAEGERGAVKLRVANALFGQVGEPFVPEFLEIVTKRYDAELRSLDFRTAPDPSRKEINTWVESKTEDKIKDLLQSGTIESNTSLVLVNAVYFKADWAQTFDPSSTSDAPFRVGVDKTVRVPTMHKTATFPLRSTDDLQVLRMPYQEGRQSMYIFLPKKSDGLPDLEEKFAAADVEKLIADMPPQRVAVALPKFRSKTSFELAGPLKAMGMKTAFGSDADFSGIRPSGDLQVSDVVHQAFVAVDEKGTEAAAATAVIMARMAAPISQPIPFTADHPFLFLIRDDRTGAWLFLGRVSDPRS
ncbi:MAG: serpin family protein [Isosphaeraceae bacterium]|nr:serpin family protein [Isosphaeraceae bacterium]